MKSKSLLEINADILAKKYSPKEVFEYFLLRSKKHQDTLNAYVNLEKNVLDAVPIAIKDNFCTSQDLPTTASSKLLENYMSPYESTVTKKLILAGFGTIGKTNMDAFAHGSSTDTSDFGVTKNPHDLSRYPGGSSGGSAVAVSAGLAPVAIGSETAGSIRQPASWTGVVGLKPTYGRVSRYGLIAMCSSTDCPGTLTKTVGDASFLLDKIAGKDMFDASSLDINLEKFIENPLVKYKIGVCDIYETGVQSDVLQAYEKGVQLFEKMGHEIVKVKLMDPKYAISVYTILQRAEVSSNLARLDGIRYGNDRTTFGEEAKLRIMLGTYTLSSGYYDAYYKKALGVANLMKGDFKRVFQEVDFLFSPTTPTTALPIGDTKKYSFFGEMMDILTEPAAIAGLPAISFPIGLDKNKLPIGGQIMAPWLNEEKMLNIARQFEISTDNFYGIPNLALNFFD